MSFGRLSRNEELRKAIESALETYLGGLNDGDAEIRQEVIGQLDGIPIQRTAIAAVLAKFLERSDVSQDDRQAAVTALACAGCIRRLDCGVA